MTHAEIAIIVVTFLQNLPKILSAMTALIAERRRSRQDKRLPSRDQHN